MLTLESVTEAVAGIVISALFVVWLLLAATQYLPQVAKWVIRFDYLQLVPQWTFFAPVPNSSDYFLYVRVLAGEHLSAWREVKLAEDRQWSAFVWNPGRRVRKGFFDLTIELSRLSTQLREEVIISLPYLLLLTVATAAVANGPYDQVQFAIGQVIPANPNAEVGVLFCSEFHAIDPNSKKS